MAKWLFNFSKIKRDQHIHCILKTCGCNWTVTDAMFCNTFRTVFVHFVASWVDPRHKMVIKISNISTISICRVILYKLNKVCKIYFFFSPASKWFFPLIFLKFLYTLINFFIQVVYMYLPCHCNNINIRYKNFQKEADIWLNTKMISNIIQQPKCILWSIFLIYVYILPTYFVK